MEEKLLRQEEEFYRYNAQLELKTKSLIKEVETVMNWQDHTNAPSAIDYGCELSPSKSEGGYENFSEKSRRGITPNIKERRAQSARSGSSSSLQSHRDQVIENSDDINFVKEKSRASDSMIKVLQSKVKVLQNELNTLKSDYLKKVDEWRKTKHLAKQLEDEKSRALSQINILREQLNQRQSSVSGTADKLRHKEVENASLKKEIENLRKDIKSKSQALSTNDVRLNRALEEVDRLKTALKISNSQEKELQSAARQTVDRMSSTVKKLEKQKAELMHSFRQQIQLIENLKSQKVISEATIMSKLIEEKFFELLNSEPNSRNGSHKMK